MAITPSSPIALSFERQEGAGIRGGGETLDQSKRIYYPQGANNSHPLQNREGPAALYTKVSIQKAFVVLTNRCRVCLRKSYLAAFTNLLTYFSDLGLSPARDGHFRMRKMAIDHYRQAPKIVFQPTVDAKGGR